MSEEMQETIKRSYNLKNLYLDPNNYRFVDNDKYIEVSSDNLTDDTIQKRTKTFIEGTKRENIKDLISSFKTNGFLDVDVIQVRDLGNNQYLVIEGNRRVTALKALQEDYENGMDIGNLDPVIFRKVPFEIHNNEENEKHLIIMGLKHISGNKKWSAINQAKLIYDYLKEYWNSELYYDKEVQLCDSLGINKQKLRSSQRAYHLILEYKKSDFGDQFESDDYSIFVEITKRPNIKEWLEWDDNIYKAQNKINQERLFSWISKTEELIDEDSLDNDETQEYEELEPIITKAVEIRDLAIFIKNENALVEMEKYRSISRGLLASGEIDRQNYEKSLSELSKGINRLRSYKDMISYEDIEELQKIKDNFLEVIPKKSTLNIVQGNVSVCFEHGKDVEHFASIGINDIKVFKDFEINNLNKINIFAGFNNTGKTSLLEAVYLLTRQNDIASFFELIRLKNKLQVLNPLWLNQTFSSSIDISGVYNNTQTSVAMKKFEARDIDKKDDYIASYELKSVVDKRVLDNTVHTFGYETLRRENEKVEYLCNSIIKSPYYYNFNEILKTHEKSLRYKDENHKTAIDMIVEFVKKIDSEIRYIELSEIDDSIKRFIVDANTNTDNLDITNYGEGLQRIFEIALSFAYCKNGVICIDEFETAIHYSLLVDFTRFIQELADMFNVQVFITTHSKECISAFIENKYSNDEISFFTMTRDREKKIQSIHYDAQSLQNELEQDAEVRGW